MGASPHGIVVYGYNLGGGDVPWEVEETGEYGELNVPWCEPYDDPVSGVKKVLLASVGFTEKPWAAEGYHARKREAETRLGVELLSHCSSDAPMFALVAHEIDAEWGDAEVLDFAALEKQRVEQGWDAKLQAALTALGITPKQAAPAWLLLAYQSA